MLASVGTVTGTVQTAKELRSAVVKHTTKLLLMPGNISGLKYYETIIVGKLSKESSIIFSLYARVR